MNKRLSGLLTMSAVLFAGSAIATNANAVESKTSLQRFRKITPPVLTVYSVNLVVNMTAHQA